MGQAYREMTPDEIRADELGNLLSWLEVPPESTGPQSVRDVVNAVRTRMEIFEGKRPEGSATAEQPDDPIARISGAIRSEARDLSVLDRLDFFQRITREVSRMVAEQVDGEVQTDDTVEKADTVGFDGEDLTQRLIDLNESITASAAIGSAIELLNGPSCENIADDKRYILATLVSTRLAQILV